MSDIQRYQEAYRRSVRVMEKLKALRRDQTAPTAEVLDTYHALFDALIKLHHAVAADIAIPIGIRRQILPCGKKPKKGTRYLVHDSLAIMAVKAIADELKHHTQRDADRNVSVTGEEVWFNSDGTLDEHRLAIRIPPGVAEQLSPTSRAIARAVRGNPRVHYGADALQPAEAALRDWTTILSRCGLPL